MTGAHSVFQQLSHDLYLPQEHALIQRAIMWSNGSGVQPRTFGQHQKEFDELLSLLNIPSSALASEKLEQLRQTPIHDLVNCIDQMKFSQFRATSDGDFIEEDLFTKINSGDYGRRMGERGMKLFIGENRDEHNLYRNWKIPGNSWQEVFDRLRQDYPERIVESVMNFYAPDKQLRARYADWTFLFGHIYADLQVHYLERGFIDRLVKAGLVPGRHIFRYRIDRRMDCADAFLPPSWGATHATDDAIWWWGNGWADGLTGAEKKMVAPLHEAFARFATGDVVTGWDSTDPRAMRRLDASGVIDTWLDTYWDESLTVWDLACGS
jgi:carboxylesterase type B